MNVNSDCVDLINAYWREQGLDPEARVESVSIYTVYAERGETSTRPVIVSNMVDGFPTKRVGESDDAPIY